MASPSLSAACAVLVANIGNFSAQITKFVASYRQARREMDAVSREISSLKLCAETLCHDSVANDYPQSMHHNLVEIIGKCDAITVQMMDLLRKLSSDDVGNGNEWNAYNQSTISNERSNLVAYRSTLDIALDMSAVLVAPSMSGHGPTQLQTNKNADSPAVNLFKEIRLLRLQVINVKQRDHSGGVLIERFLDDLEGRINSVREADCSKDLDAQLAENSPRLAREESLENAATASASSGSEAENKQFPASDGDGASATDATSNASTRTTKPSSEPPPPTAGNVTRAVAQTGSDDVVGDRQANAAQASDKTLRRKPVSFYSAPELDLRGVQDAPQLEHAARGPRAQSQDTITDGLVRGSLPLEFSSNPLPQTHPALLKPDDAPLIPVEAEPERGKLNYAAINAAAAKWAKLSANKQLKLSKHFETLIRGKRDVLQGRGFWMNEKVGSYEEIKQALDGGARLNSSWGNDKDGFPLDPLVTEMRNSKRRKVMELLLSRGARADNLDKILIAVSFDLKDFVELLLDYGADVGARDRPNNSPLSYAAGNGSVHMVRLLLDRGADVNGRAGQFGTALQAASQQGSFNTVQHLLDRGADVNAQGGYYGNALQAACWWRHGMVAQLLLEHGADVNALGQYGTALRAARMSNAQCGEQQTRQTINLLIAYGAVDEKHTKENLEIRPMLPPRPSASSPSSGQSPMAYRIHWA